MIVDYDGRIVAQATPGSSEKIVVAPIDLEMLRTERKKRLAHQMSVHLRTEAHTIYQRSVYPRGGLPVGDVSYQDNERRIEQAKAAWKPSKQS